MTRYNRRTNNSIGDKLVAFLNLDNPVLMAINLVVSVMATAVIYVGAVFAAAPKKMDDKALEPLVRDLTDMRVSADSLAARGFYTKDLYILKTDYGPAYVDSCRDIYMREKGEVTAAFSDSQRRWRARQIADCVHTAGKAEHDVRTEKAANVAAITLRVGLELLSALAESENSR